MPPRRSTVRVHIHPLGDTALIAELGTRLDSALNTRAIALAAALKKRRDVHQAVVGAVSVTVSFDPDLISHDALGAAIRRLATKRPPIEEPGRLHRMTVLYHRPDLNQPASSLGVTPRQVIELDRK